LNTRTPPGTPLLLYNLDFHYRLHKSVDENIHYTEVTERNFMYHG